MGFGMGKVEWIPMCPQKSLMKFRVTLQLLSDVVKTVTEFLNMSSWSHLAVVNGQ